MLVYNGEGQYNNLLRGDFGTSQPFQNDQRMPALNSNNYTAMVPLDLPAKLCGNVRRYRCILIK